MAIMSYQLRRELNYCLKNLYETGHVFSTAASKTYHRQLGAFLRDGGDLYREIGDHLTLAIASEDRRTNASIDPPAEKYGPWTDQEDVLLSKTDKELCNTIKNAHVLAEKDLMAVLNLKDIPDNIALVIRSGKLQISSLLNRFRTFEDLREM
jgi:hypothetical protein